MDMKDKDYGMGFATIGIALASDGMVFARVCKSLIRFT
jgi:hypothetical protein